MSEPLNTDAILAAFVAAGAEVVAPSILQPAGALLDLYGEDIRARAFVTHDPIEGETMLRPDFTVPVVQTHMGRSDAPRPARYAYAGPVFRKQEAEDRPREDAVVLLRGGSRRRGRLSLAQGVFTNAHETATQQFVELVEEPRRSELPRVSHLARKIVLQSI